MTAAAPAIRFDHLLHWVRDLDAAIAQYQALGFAAQMAGEHPATSVRNGGWPSRTGEHVEAITAANPEAVWGPREGGIIAAALRAGGAADCVTTVVLDGPGAPEGEVAGLRYRRFAGGVGNGGAR